MNTWTVYTEQCTLYYKVAVFKLHENTPKYYEIYAGWEIGIFYASRTDVQRRYS